MNGHFIKAGRRGKKQWQDGWLSQCLLSSSSFAHSLPLLPSPHRLLMPQIFLRIILLSSLLWSSQPESVVFRGKSPLEKAVYLVSLKAGHLTHIAAKAACDISHQSLYRALKAKMQGRQL
jgi:hypothetical protein